MQQHNPSITNITERGALTKNDHLNLRDEGLQFAFGIEGWADDELKDDPSYVKIIVRLLGKLDGEKYERIIPHRKCTSEDYEKFATPAKEAVTMFEMYKTDPNRNLFCIDWEELGEDIEIYGNWRDASKYQRIEFLLTPCNYVHTKLGWDGDYILDGCIEDLQKQKDYITKSSRLVVLMADQYFDQQNFGSEPIAQESKFFIQQLDISSPTYIEAFIQESIIEDELDFV